MGDGRDTKQRVLEAACEVFAQKGYRDATVHDICSAAGANVAAVNYYFGGKGNLYLAAWKHMSDTVHQQYFENLYTITDPVARLRGIIVQRVRHAFDDGPAGAFRRLIQREMGDPTEVHAEVWDRFIRPLMDLVAETVAKVLGVDLSDPAARRCAFSVQSQLVSLARLRMKPESPPLQRLLGNTTPTAEQIDELAEHIAVFVMGGIRAAARAGVPAQEATP